MRGGHATIEHEPAGEQAADTSGPGPVTRPEMERSGAVRPRLGAAIALGLIAGYRRFVSPALPPACRFYPSCSAYAQQAIERYGLSRGTVRAVARLLKCHPFHPGGFDPVD